MRIAVAQTQPVSGDIQSNIERHNSLVDLAISVDAELVCFPELSVTGYEPALAKDLAIDPDDRRFDVFQNRSNTERMTIGIGVPTRHRNGVCISTLIFQPDQARQLYSKKFLHSDEYPYFVPGRRSCDVLGKETNIALAICYELSVAEHAAEASRGGAEIYFAMVAKSIDGVDKAIERLGNIARDYSMTVLMSNCVGLSDGLPCAGKSSVWNSKGELLAQLGDSNEGIIIVDTSTNETGQHTIDGFAETPSDELTERR